MLSYRPGLGLPGPVGFQYRVVGGARGMLGVLALLFYKRLRVGSLLEG